MPDIFIDKEEQQEIAEKKIDKNTLRPLSFFCIKPEGVLFETQEEDEIVYLFLRRHFVTNTGWVLTALFSSLIPPLFLAVLNQVNYHMPIPYSYLGAMIIFFYLLLLTYSFISFITWFYNISLITNKRIVEINYSDLVYRHISATKLELIQDVSYTQVGVFRSIFDYGNLMVQTAATIDNFEFEQAPHPEDIIRILEPLIGKK